MLDRRGKGLNGEECRFHLMEGTGIFGAIGGGQSQAGGAQALLAFLDRGEAASI